MHILFLSVNVAQNSICGDVGDFFLQLAAALCRHLHDLVTSPTHNLTLFHHLRQERQHGLWHEVRAPAGMQVHQEPFMVGAFIIHSAISYSLSLYSHLFELLTF